MGTPKKKTVKASLKKVVNQEDFIHGDSNSSLNNQCQDPRIEELTKQVQELQAKLAEIETRERAQDVYNSLLESTQELQQKIQNLELSNLTLSVKSDLKGFSVRDFPILDLNETVGPEEIDINPVDIKKLFVSEINILIKNYAADINQKVDDAIKENLFPQMDLEYGKFDLLSALEDGKNYQEFMKCR